MRHYILPLICFGLFVSAPSFAQENMPPAPVPVASPELAPQEVQQKTPDALVPVSNEDNAAALQVSGNTAPPAVNQALTNGDPNAKAAEGDDDFDAKDGINPARMPSVLFTFWEHSAILDAKRSRGMARPPSEAELARELNTMQKDDRVKPPPEERDIALGGIVYRKTNDWTIWLNGKRVTPDALPEEIIDLKVHGQYIELKWYDDWSNQIFPIRLRPHQRFNIDTRIFLPG